jgi:hypothetical protein
MATAEWRREEGSVAAEQWEPRVAADGRAARRDGAEDGLGVAATGLGTGRGLRGCGEDGVGAGAMGGEAAARRGGVGYGEVEKKERRKSAPTD